MEDKIYFAKYLKVKEEIKPGCTVLVDNPILADPYIKNVTKRDLKKLEGQKVYPVALHLLDRTIKEGDYIRYFNSSKIYQVTKTFANKNYVFVEKGGKDNFPVNIDKYFPVTDVVIGRVSNKATWLKEFDEVHQGDVKVNKGIAKVRCLTCKKLH